MKQQMIQVGSVLLIALAILLVLSSCLLPLGQGAGGTIIVQFGARARTVVPEADLGITSITVTVTHLGGTATGGVTSVADTCTIGNLAPGPVTVSAVVSDGTNTVATGFVD